MGIAGKSLQSCPTLCDPVDCSLPGSSVHGIFQARVLEWGAIAFCISDLTKDNFSSSLGKDATRPTANLGVILINKEALAGFVDITRHLV